MRFKQSNADALPDNLSFRLDRQASLQERITDAQRRRADLIDQKERLKTVFQATGSLTGIDSRDLPPEQRQLRELQAELDNALTIYSETNPRVVLLQTRIDQLERVVAGQGILEQEERPRSTSMLDIEISRLDGEIEALANQIVATETELEAISDSIARTPANAIALEALERDYANVQNQYNAAVARLGRAQTGERIELLSKGERITVVEQATVPNSPTSPNRPRIAQAGVAAGFALAAGLFVLLEILNNAIRRPKELTTALGITPFAVVPYMATQSEQRSRRLIWLGLIFGVVLVISAALFAIQTFYLPLDLVFSKIFDRLGLGGLL